ncbi:MAG: cupin domain-containing protein [Vicinamibacterales bacterium]
MSDGPAGGATTTSRHTYPHTIDNGAGERITFLGREPGRVGERVVGENLTSPGAGPPMHVHHYQEESFTVVRGRLGYQRLGQPERFAGPGETVTFAAGEAHRFWNPGPDDLVATASVEPADNAEFFLGALFASARRHGGTRPDPFDAAFLLSRYRREFTLVGIPPLVVRVVFPLQVAIGRLLGKYGHYADAPPPVRR